MTQKYALSRCSFAFVCGLCFLTIFSATAFFARPSARLETKKSHLGHSVAVRVAENAIAISPTIVRVAEGSVPSAMRDGTHRKVLDSSLLRGSSLATALHRALELKFGSKFAPTSPQYIQAISFLAKYAEASLDLVAETLEELSPGANPYERYVLVEIAREISGKENSAQEIAENEIDRLQAANERDELSASNLAANDYYLFALRQSLADQL